MKVVIDNITLNPDETQDSIRERVRELYGLDIGEYVILRKSLDARKKDAIVYRYRIRAVVSDDAGIDLRIGNIRMVPEEEPDDPAAPEEWYSRKRPDAKIIIAGSGPAGIFCALRLIEAGYRVTIFERGRGVDERMKDIGILERDGILNPESNVLFGEGGAGTYSDGKLTARTLRPETTWLFSKLISFGAPSSIQYEARPHLGTDRLRGIVRKMRKEIIESGSEIYFNERIDDILLMNSRVAGVATSRGRQVNGEFLVLATGHSARDTYELLERKGIYLEKKDFAMGVRVEHPRELIDSLQYGRSRFREILPAAEYALTFRNAGTGRGIYSFCMCPGGAVINSSSEQGRLCLNGMSFSKRDHPWSNAAVIVTVKGEDSPEGVLGGIEFQRMLEENAFRSGGGNFCAPAQRITSFLNGKTDTALPRTSYANGVTPADLGSALPSWIAAELAQAFRSFDKKMRGFVSDQGIIISAETRSSSPVRITRGKDFQSVNMPGLLPVGEGSGYAGGIVSSAVDGIRAADAIISKI